MIEKKIVVESEYINCDTEYDIEFSEDEVEGMSNEDIEMNFSEDIWDVIQNHLVWHIEDRELDDE